MDGSPVRGQDKAGVAQLNHIKDPQSFHAEIIRLIHTELPNTEVFFGILDHDSKELQVPVWVRSHLERHPGLALKLNQGAMVGISRIEQNPVPRPAAAARSSVVLIPIIDDGALLGAIGLVSPLDSPQLSAEDIEGVRQLANNAAPILGRLQEIDALTRKIQELTAICERAARAEEDAAKAMDERNQFDALLKLGRHTQSNIAHELRTPLAAIRGYARMILDGRSGDINDTQRQYLRIIAENTNRLIDVANWMTRISELSTQKFSLSTFDLRNVWSESANKNQELLTTQSLTLAERIPDESFEIIGDPTKLAYVFNELITAATKSAEPGSLITVEFSHGREREVTVKISALNSTTSTTQNTDEIGISLSGMREAVGIHGGRVFVNSTPGQGHTFLFTLPAIKLGGEDKNDEQAVNFGSR